MERLNKYLAHAGLGSRRHCEELIVGGHVTVDDIVVRQLGTKVDPATSKVSVDGQALSTERHVYWLLNKPRGYLCTNDDPGGRPRAIDLVDHIRQRVYTVGRLDEDSEGLLLLTNDGDLAHKLMHPRFGIEKTYQVQVAGLPTREQLDKLLEGVWMSDGHIKPKAVKRLKQQGESTWLEIVLAEGRNREIRRMLAGLGHKVMRLKRIALGTIHLGRLARGKSRPLSPPELTALRFAVRHITGADAEEEPAPEATEARQEERPRPARSTPTEGRGTHPPRGDFRPARPNRPGGPFTRSSGPPDGRRGPGRPVGARPTYRPGASGPADNRSEHEGEGERRPRHTGQAPTSNQRPRGPGRPPGDRRGPGRADGPRSAFHPGEGRPSERRGERAEGPPRDRRPFDGPGDRPPRGRRPAGPGRPPGDRRGPGRPDGDRRPTRSGERGPSKGPGRPGRPRPIVPKTRHKRKST
jgi:23S rRNA pseudouridine2605 synthase